MDKDSFQIRNLGGYFSVGSEEDGPVSGMFKFSNKLIVLKTKAIYEIVEADQVDPERMNPNLSPIIQRKLLSLGSESEVVSKTFLTARILFDKNRLHPYINVTHALELAFEAMIEINAMITTSTEIGEAVSKACKEYESLADKNTSYLIPSLSDVSTRCKTFFQKADHVTQAAMEIITIFYPDKSLNQQSHFDSFLKFLEKEYGTDEPFYDFMKTSLPFLKLIRNCRNSLDHRLQVIKIYDFEIQGNGSIFLPSLEINFRDTQQDRISLTKLLPNLCEDMLIFFEQTIVYLCSKNSRTDGIPFIVRHIPEEKRRNKYIQYCYWLGIGEEGYYNQF